MWGKYCWTVSISLGETTFEGTTVTDRWQFLSYIKGHWWHFSRKTSGIWSQLWCLPHGQLIWGPQVLSSLAVTEMSVFTPISFFCWKQPNQERPRRHQWAKDRSSDIHRKVILRKLREEDHFLRISLCGNLFIHTHTILHECDTIIHAILTQHFSHFCICLPFSLIITSYHLTPG